MKGEFKKILEIGVPSTIAWGGHIFYNIVDNLMIGKLLGTESLAVAGISGAVYFIFLVLGMGASNILTAMISESLAKKVQNESIKVFQNGIVVCALIGFSLFFILFFGGNFIVQFLSKQPELNARIFSYLNILSFAPIPVMIFFAFERLCEGMNRAKISMYTVLLCNISNAFLNYGLLTGSFGLPNIGVNGAAIATLVNSVLEVVIIISLVKRDVILKKLLAFKFQYFSGSYIWKIASLGIPGGILFFLEGTAFNVASFIASKSSINDVAAHQLLLWTINGFMVPLFGFSTAITARIAYNIQDKKEVIAFKIGLFGFGISALYMFLAMVFFFVFKLEILGLMLKGDAEDLITMNLIISMLGMMIITETFDGMQVMGGGILRGYKDTQVPAVFALISYWGLCIPLGYFFAIVKNMGVYGIWLGIGFGIFVQAILFFFRFYLKYKPKVA